MAFYGVCKGAVIKLGAKQTHNVKQFYDYRLEAKGLAGNDLKALCHT
jgi:hypothetical protein